MIKTTIVYNDENKTRVEGPEFEILDDALKFIRITCRNKTYNNKPIIHASILQG